MATKASNFTPAGTLDGTEIVPVIKGGNKRTTTQEIADLNGGGVVIDDTTPDAGKVYSSHKTQDIVDAEATARATQDTTLQDNIDAEAAARIAADALKLNIADYNDRFKGKYTTLSALTSAHPTASAGDYAQVDAGAGSNVVNYNWDTQDGWVEGSAIGPTLSTTDDLTEGSTNLYFTTARVQAAITGTANRVTVTAGVVDIASTYVGQNTITTLGTIGTGTWQGTPVGLAYGGTGFSAYAKGDLIHASATNTLAKLGIGTTGQVLTVVSGDIAWADAAGGLPSQTGNSGKFLTTDGTSASWGAVTGWGTTGNAGTTAGTNFIGTTDAQKLVFKTNNRIYGFFGESGGFILKAPYSASNDAGLEFGYSSGSSTFYINGGGVSKGDTDNTWISGGAWASGYYLVFGTPANNIMKLSNTGVTVSGLTISGSSDLTLPSGRKLSFGSTRIDTSGGVIAIGYDGFNTWKAALRNGSTNILLADSNGLININPAGAATVSSAALSVTSTTLGFLPPRMTTTQRDAIASPAEGLLIYNTSTHKLNVYTTAWEQITSA